MERRFGGVWMVAVFVCK